MGGRKLDSTDNYNKAWGPEAEGVLVQFGAF